MGLCVGLKVGEGIRMGDIVVVVKSRSKGHVRLFIEAPKEIKINRVIKTHKQGESNVTSSS